MMSAILVYMFHRGANVQINEYLNSKEIECQCSWEECNKVIITKDTERSFYNTREDFGGSIIVSSGNRCNKRNILIGGAENSSHSWGDGLDMTPGDGDLDRLEASAKKYFKFVIRYKSHIHVDNRNHK